MMYAKDLMIGDWVKFPIGNDKVVDLLYIEGKGICASFSASATLFPVEVEKLQPIPLTPEILEKNGFSRNGLDIALFDRKGGDDFIGAANLQYVHELQHALRLCGIKKEIEL